MMNNLLKQFSADTSFLQIFLKGKIVVGNLMNIDRVGAALPICCQLGGEFAFAGVSEPWPLRERLDALL